MWYFRNHAAPAVSALVVLAFSGAATGATLDVCPTCTHTTLDSAFAAAGPDDVIVLDGPDEADTTVQVDYILSTNLVINLGKTGLQIRGASKSRPDQIRVVGAAGGPVITVEAEQSFEARGFTIEGGTTGILAMADSDVDIRQCLIDGSAGVGIDCVNPEEVYLAATVVTNSGSDAVRIDMGGELNITQCTFLTNGGFGVNAIAGMANVVATLIHDSGQGMDDGTGTALELSGNWVTDASGAVIVNPGGATDPYAETDTLDPAVVFSAAADSFPGQIAAGELRRTEETAATLNAAMTEAVLFFQRDFSNLGRNLDDVAIGADELIAAAIAGTWLECYIIQRGQVRNWVGEAPATIEVSTDGISLVDAQLWIANPFEGFPLDADLANQILVGTVTVESSVDTNFGFIDYTFDADVFAAAFTGIPDVNTTGYEIYIQPDGVLVDDPDVLDADEAQGAQAEIGRVFGFDTIPPTVVNAVALADQYLDPPGDGSAIDAGAPFGWGTLAGVGLLGNVGANSGWLDGSTGDPQVFFDGILGDPLDFTIAVRFTDEGAGFETDGLPVGSASTPGAKYALLYETYEDVPGMAWWDQNIESEPELITGPPTVEAQYAVSNGNLTLDARWIFTGAVHDGVNQWHAVANIRVVDLAGNEATLSSSGTNFVPLKPFHLWWFPIAGGEFRSGPGGRETANPVFTWGLERFGSGQDPEDPQPCFPSVRYYVWQAVDPNNLAATSWTDISGNWSQWMNPANRTITLDTFFNAPTRLRDLLTGGDGAAYLIALQGWDEAGNIQSAPAAPIGPLPNAAAVAPLSFHYWKDAGADESAGLDTRVQATFWHNYAGVPGVDRTLGGGERSFGAQTQIPLPAAEGDCVRVEGGFAIAMDLPDSVTAANNPRVYFELYEDGAFVLEGVIDPSSVGGGYTFAIPQDLLNPAAVGLNITGGSLDFLNPSWCEGVSDRLGDDGPAVAESPYRQRDVRYQLLLGTQITVGPDVVTDSTPATVEFTVTVDRGLKDDQPVKSFVRQ